MEGAGGDALWRTAVQFDAEKNIFGAVAVYSLLLLLEAPAKNDADCVRSVHFRDRVRALLASLSDRSLMSRPGARLFLLADEEGEEEELASEGLLQVFDERGSTRLLVCVGERGFIVEPSAALPNNPLVTANRYAFRPAGFAVLLPEPDALFAGALVPPVLPRVLDESSRVVQAFSSSVSDAIRSGAATVAARIQSGSAAAAAAVAPQEGAEGGENKAMEGNAMLRDTVLPHTAAGAHLVRQRTEELSERLKVSGAHAGQVLREQAGPPRSASAASGLTLAATAALGAMSVFGALWDSGGEILRASGQGAVDVAGSRYGPAVRDMAQNGLDATTDAVVVVDKVISAPKTLIKGALE